MKKLGKLNINPQRIMTSEGLLSLRGGDYEGCHWCLWSYNGENQFWGYCCCGDCTPPQASQICSEYLSGWTCDCGC